uniref:Uncharacterized protein n=1 Tax=Beauveria bassiana polymycovirus 3 TaxID=1740648 RepID=A0A7R9NGD6_9VIRU|nr:protein of unknown function [Beauveria bassiana polymycovirus 3]
MPFLGTHLPPAVANVRVGRDALALHRSSQSSEFTGANGVPREWVVRLVPPDGPWPDPQFNLRFRLTDWAVEQLPAEQREIACDVDVVYYPVFLPLGSYSALDPGPGLYWLFIDGLDPWLSIRVIDVIDAGLGAGAVPVFIDRVSGRTGPDPLLLAVEAAELGSRGPVFGR